MADKEDPQQKKQPLGGYFLGQTRSHLSISKVENTSNEASTVGVKQLVTHQKSYIVESLLLLPSKRRFLTVTATSVE